jgi:hypothetical protein
MKTHSIIVLVASLSWTSCGHQRVLDYTIDKVDKKGWIHEKKGEDSNPEIRSDTLKEVIEEIIEEFRYDFGTVCGADLSNFGKLKFIEVGDPATEENPNRAGACEMKYDPFDNELIHSAIMIKEANDRHLFKAFLYHELGHCVLLLPHTEQDPQHMMSPVLRYPEKNFYEVKWDHLVKDMCSHYHSGARIVFGE